MSAPPRTVLDYVSAATFRSHVPSDRGLLITSAIFTSVVGLAILVAITDLLIVNWPSFGMILIAVPVGLVALAFLSIAFTALRFAVRS